MDRKRKVSDADDGMTPEKAIERLRDGLLGLKRSLEAADNELQNAREGILRRRQTAISKESSGDTASVSSKEEIAEAFAISSSVLPNEQLESNRGCCQSYEEQKEELRRLQHLRWERALAEQQACTASNSVVHPEGEPQNRLARLKGIDSLAQEKAVFPAVLEEEPPPQSSDGESSNNEGLQPPTYQQREAHRQRYLRRLQAKEVQEASVLHNPPSALENLHMQRTQRKLLVRGQSQPASPERNDESFPLEQSSTPVQDATNQSGDHHDEKECRVCRSGEEDGRPLFYPCRCKGSIKYIHQDCLLEWLKVSKSKEKCELCGELFRFTPVYKEGAPKRLSLYQLFAGLLRRGMRWVSIAMRAALMGSLWLTALPVLTIATGRLCFRITPETGLPTMRDVTAVLPGWSIMDILNDSFYGSGLCVVILAVTASLVMLFGPLEEEERPANQIEPAHPQADAAGVENGLENAQVPGEAQQHVENEQEVNAAEPPQDLPEEAQPGANEEVVQQQNPEEDEIIDIDEEGGLFDAVGFLGDEEGNFQVLWGMEGPIMEAVLIVVQTLFFNIAFLIIFQLGPFQLGRWLWSVAEQRGFDNPFQEALSVLKENDTDNLFKHESGAVSREVAAKFLSLIQVGQNVACLGLGYLVTMVVVLVVVAVILSLHAATNPGNLHPVTADLILLVNSCIKGMGAFIRIWIFLLLNFILVPLWTGALSDLCTIKAFNSTPRERIASFVELPLLSLGVHWLIGFILILGFSLVTYELRKVLHRDVLKGFLPVPREEIVEGGILQGLIENLMGGGGNGRRNNPPAPNGGAVEPVVAEALPPPQPPAPAVNEPGTMAQLLMGFMMPIVMMAICLFFPVNYGHILLPGLASGPLALKFVEPFQEVQLPLELLLFHVAFPVAIERLHIRSHCYFMLLGWCRMGGRLLGIEAWLLDAHYVQRPEIPAQADAREIIPNNQLFRRAPVARVCPQHLWARLSLFLVMSAACLAVLSTFLVHLPIYAGRFAFEKIGLPVQNDFYAYCVGLLITCTIIMVLKSALRCVATARQRFNACAVIAQMVLSWSLIAVKWCVLLFFWLMVIPLLIGTFFECVLVIPIRVPIDEIPNSTPYSNWALGVVFLKIWLRLVLLGVFGECEWKQKFEQVRRNGIRGVELYWTLKNVCLPFLNQAGEFLFVPYFLVEAPLPWITTLPPQQLLYARRYCFSGYLILKAAYMLSSQLMKSLIYLHDRLLDDQYLVGLELNNLTTD